MARHPGDRPSLPGGGTCKEALAAGAESFVPWKVSWEGRAEFWFAVAAADEPAVELQAPVEAALPPGEAPPHEWRVASANVLTLRFSDEASGSGPSTRRLELAAAFRSASVDIVGVQGLGASIWPLDELAAT